MQKFITPTWDDFYKRLEYKRLNFNNEEALSTWVASGHGLEATKIFVYQTDDHPLYPTIISNFPNLRNTAVCIHKIMPGNYIPTHSDTYLFYRKRYNIIDVNNIHRYIIFLEDWKDGHYLKIGDTMYMHWSKGDCVGWVGETPHSAINLGMDDRYTMQVTGEYYD